MSASGKKCHSGLCRSVLRTASMYTLILITSSWSGFKSSVLHVMIRKITSRDTKVTDAKEKENVMCGAQQADKFIFLYIFSSVDAAITALPAVQKFSSPNYTQLF